jgi:methionine-S-sulfoxide reductase
MKSPAIIGIVCAAAAIGATAIGLQNRSQVSAGVGKVGIQPIDSWDEAKKAGREIAVFGGGCFWCTERDFRVVPGVTSTSVGYMGGHVKNPTYKQVCTTDTGHAEVTLVEFDPNVISYEKIVDAFFKMHDPTQWNRQGPDIGSQYRSVIFWYSEDQRKVAEDLKKKVGSKLNATIATQIVKAEPYYWAEKYHQQYYEKRGYIGKYGG